MKSNYELLIDATTKARKHGHQVLWSRKGYSKYIAQIDEVRYTPQQDSQDGAINTLVDIIESIRANDAARSERDKEYRAYTEYDLHDDFSREDLMLTLKNFYIWMTDYAINTICLRTDLTYKDIASVIVWEIQVQYANLTMITDLDFIPKEFPQAAKYYHNLSVKREEDIQRFIDQTMSSGMVFHIKPRHTTRKLKHFDISTIDVNGDK